MLDGTIRVIEGRGYAADGSVGFNALGVVSYDPDARTYSLTSWALGHSADRAADDHRHRLTSGRAPAGPGAVIRYTATIGDGSWHEVGERIAQGRAAAAGRRAEPSPRVDSDWPAAGAVPMR